MRPTFRILAALLIALHALAALAADYDNPLAVIAANPQLSEIHAIVKRIGYDQPLGAGGDVTFLAPTNRLLDDSKVAADRFTYTDLFRDKIPMQGQLLIMQGLTLDGQFPVSQMEALVKEQGSGKATLPTILGEPVKFRIHRDKSSGDLILEDATHKGLFNGLVVKAANEYVTPNGMVIVVDAVSAVPK